MRDVHPRVVAALRDAAAAAEAAAADERGGVAAAARLREHAHAHIGGGGTEQSSKWEILKPTIEASHCADQVAVLRVFSRSLSLSLSLSRSLSHALSRSRARARALSLSLSVCESARMCDAAVSKRVRARARFDDGRMPSLSRVLALT